MADFAGLYENRGVTTVNTVPTAAARVGDFSDYRDRNGNLIPIYDPLTTRPNPNGTGLIRDPFPGNVIPANRLNQVGLNVASIYPLPNGSGNFDNYTSTTDRAIRDYAFTVRVDHRQNDRDSFFFRYSYDKFQLDAPQGQAACCLATPSEAAAKFDLGPYVAGIQNTRLTAMGGAFNWTHIFGPSVVNELRLGFAKTNPETRQSDFGHQSAESLGIQGINVTEYTTGLPNLNIQDLTGISGGPAFLPVNPKQTHYQVEDTLSWVGGPARGEGRLPLRAAPALALHQHRHPQQHLDQPQPHEQPADQLRRYGHRDAAARLHHRRRARLPARAVRHDELRALLVRAGRLEGQRAPDS